MYRHQAGDTRASFNNLGREQDKNGQHMAGEYDRHGTIPESLEDRLGQGLSPEHLQSLREGSAIAPEDILARGYITVLDLEELRNLGFAEHQLRTPALGIPVHGVEDGSHFYRIRPDEPREDKNRPGKGVKYEQPKGTGVVLDVPPRARPILSDPSKRLWVTEGEKKADSLASQGECALGLLGVWSWKRDGLPLSDWDLIRLVGREVLIAFDSDAERKVEVKRALLALAGYLTVRGAKVKIVKLPDAADGSKQGVDDFLAASGSVEGMVELSKVFTGMEVGDPKWPVMADEAYHGLAGEVVRH
jgi:putative DNA primase/helicase